MLWTSRLVSIETLTVSRLASAGCKGQGQYTDMATCETHKRFDTYVDDVMKLAASRHFGGTISEIDVMVKMLRFMYYTVLVSTRFEEGRYRLNHVSGILVSKGLELTF